MATYKHDPNTEDVLDSSEDEEDNSSRFASVRGHMSSVRSNERSRASISSFFTVKGSNDKESNVYSEIEDADVIDKTDHQPFTGHVNRTEVDIIKEKNEKLCFKCKTAEAIHFCRTCRYGRQYMCYDCLQGHDDWIDGHDVVILSVDIEGNLDQQPEDLNKLGMSKEANFNRLKTSKISRQPLNVDSDEQDDENEGQNTENEMPPYKEGQAISKRFYKDELYPSIAHELRTKQRCRTDGQLQKYGMYSIRVLIQRHVLLQG
ncbi:uncharacterized protein LOC132753145 [Ruditapes philippinarum]|uniref:uncharacterized protein LOC132753145 n=1 Tax=Ruditapes philippinarum TaxID=129788 RepID=UPI00295B9086|nr:uncharacterized protein LOC132753145 [Ruditapes philippinarum]